MKTPTRTNAWFGGWTRFWFAPTDPIVLHLVRIATGVLLLAWLLPLAGQRQAFFGLDGWFDRQAFAEASTSSTVVIPKPLTWSLLYLGGGSPAVVNALYFGALAVFTLFTLGIGVRVMAVLTWLLVASFTANPALDPDADSLLLILTLYLMVGYVLTGQRSAGATALERFLGGRRFWGFGRGQAPSVGANLAVRLIQVHLAIVIVTSGVHKLQFGDWWAGVALWFPLHPPLTSSAVELKTQIRDGETYLIGLNVAVYAALGWQIGFPFFAWRRWWNWLLLGGALAGWIATAWIFRVPVYGPALFVGCLAFLEPDRVRRFLPGPREFPGPAERGSVARSLRSVLTAEDGQ